VQSSLCASSDPLAVADALLDKSGAATLYVADLDAILARGEHAAVLAALCRLLGARRPGAEVWLDAGFTDCASMLAMLARIDALAQQPDRRGKPLEAPGARARLVPVFGTETLASAKALRDAVAAGHDPILSIDHRAGQQLGATGGDAAWWPRRVIVMTLDQVGSGLGPDLATFDRLRALAGARDLIGAGGIRHARDLDTVSGAGASAWLVASALHDRRI
jgi:phosphoribosylformimino-5-aminoimidazole carboxamide ribotide isomerase